MTLVFRSWRRSHALVLVFCSWVPFEAITSTRFVDNHDHITKFSPSEVSDRLAVMFGDHLTFVNLRPLQENALSDLVCQTLRRSYESVAPLVSALAQHSHDNVFTARSLLSLLATEKHVSFDFL